jgi:predicted dithiol-disulfide oxidoreductase (DUF899 family)
VSSLRSDFTSDFGVSLPPGADPDQVVFNIATTWSRYNNAGEQEGLRAFALAAGSVDHTDSCHLRGVEAFNVTSQLLDRVPRCRAEDQLPYRQAWIRRRDEYGTASV